MSTKNQNYFNKSQARNTNFVHRIQHSTQMIKIYGMPTCPDCTYVEEQIKGNDRYQVIDIPASPASSSRTAPSPSSRKKPGSAPGPSLKAPPARLTDLGAEGGAFGG